MRFASAGLAFLLSIQSGSLGLTRDDFSQWLSAIGSAPLIAMITAPDRYAAMHQPAPARVTAPHVDASKTRLISIIHPQPNGVGERVTLPWPSKPILPKDAVKLVIPAVGASSTPSSRLSAALSQQAPVVNRNSAAAFTPLALPTHRPGGPIRAFDVTTGTPNTTGINPWWTYEEGALPGTGKYMVNVGTGNLVVQGDDVDIPERGIDLALRRTYNSGSLNDTNGSYGNDDGSATPNIYGNGWTNTFGTHLANNTSGGVTVFDIDGARYDYTLNGTGCLTPPAGMHNTLCYDGGCGYQWGKKNGTIYWYWLPVVTGCPGYSNAAAYGGRLSEIVARNQNNRITFSYYWTGGDASSTANLTQIVAQHQDGHNLTLAFGTVNGRVLLSSITRTDGLQVTYGYDTAHNLTSVTKPGNDAATTLAENYGYNAGSQLAWTSNPRWNLSSGADGSFTNFYYDSSGRATGVLLYGFANPTPSDGTSTPIQPAYTTGANTIAYSTFSYPTSGETSLTDVDGHATNWFYDTAGRVTQTQEYTGAAEGLWLVTSASWDSDNNLTESVDARSYATDYAYDSNGNTVAVALPAVSTNQGTFRPTNLYSYDRTNGANNISAFCDPVHTHGIGQDWTANPGSSDSLCPSSSGATRYTWDYSDPSTEPFGRMSSSYTPLGYHRAYSYATSAQGGDYGLPSDVVGDSMSQADGSTRAPHLTIAYDGYGNPSCTSTFQDASGTHWTRATFDVLDRVTSHADPDDASLSVSQCSNTAGLSGSHIQTTVTYNPDGTVASKQSPSAYAAGVSTTFTYDADGNEISETHDFGGQPGTTTKTYDGADRLVEVVQPHDSRTFGNGSGYDLFGYAWMTRYLYDLSQGGQVAVDGASVYAHGNLYKTQEYLPSTPIIIAGSAPTAPTWEDVRGTSFDALDRTVASYENAFGTSPKVSNSYDTTGNAGLLGQTQSALGAIMILSYLTTGWLQEKQFSNDGGVTPSESYAYDADGRATAITSSVFGAEQRSYDADGRMTTDAEPTGGGFQSPATLTYSYYDDGLRKALSVSSSQLTRTNALQYSYRPDGQLQTEAASTIGNFAWTYSPGGRELTQTDPDTGDVIQLTDGNENPTGTRTLQARSEAYDSYGRVSQLILPEGYTYGSVTYDGEGETTGYTASGAYCLRGCTSRTISNVYGIRGELLAQTPAPGSFGASSASANGFLCAVTNANASATPGTCLDSFDARSGMMLAQCSAPYSYDAAGRQISSASGPPPSGYTGGGTLSRAYDSENHPLSNSIGTSGGYWAPAPSCSATYPSYFGAINDSMAYGWGPNGHPITFTRSIGGQTPGTTYAHWDGNSVLFTSVSGGGVDFKVGTLSFGGEIIDRDMSGQQAATHDGGGFSVWSMGNPQHPAGFCKTEGCAGALVFGSLQSDPSWTDNASSETITAPRTDGYDDGTGTIIQGVRAFDNSSGQWTAPDAFAGDAHDPMSQKPFMWNHNNPLSYADPSGYYVCDNCYDSHGNETEAGKVLDDAAKAADKKVVEALKSVTDPTVRKALEALHEDLQKGKGNWHIVTGSTGLDSKGKPNGPAFTLVTGRGQPGMAGYRISIGKTTFDPTRVGDMRAITMVSEGGIYEMGTGRAGRQALSDFTTAFEYGQTPSGQEARVDGVVNSLYNENVGVEDDP